jgi:hypothetical protein
MVKIDTITSYKNMSVKRITYYAVLKLLNFSLLKEFRKIKVSEPKLKPFNNQKDFYIIICS